MKFRMGPPRERESFNDLEDWEQFLRGCAWFLGVCFYFNAILSFSSKPLQAFFSIIAAMTVFPPFWDWMYRQYLPTILYNRWIRLVILLILVDPSFGKDGFGLSCNVGDYNKDTTKIVEEVSDE